MLNTAVAFFVFNRPELTSQVFKQIQRAAPRQLFVIADGPRPDKADDVKLCAAVLELTQQITWDCEVHTLIRSENIGCRNSIAQGLDWVFTFTDRCIILEDDCWPELSFFTFCENLLQRYENDLEVMTIGGCAPEQSEKINQSSYYFSRYPNVWGWATWKRTWDLVELNLPNWDSLRSTDWLRKQLHHEQHQHFWQRTFDKMTELDTWDYALVYACWLAGGLSVRPSQNLIKNIGFIDSATHTKDPNHYLSRLSTLEMRFPLTHPLDKRPDQIIEDQIEWLLYSGINERKVFLARDAILRKRAGKI